MYEIKSLKNKGIYLFSGGLIFTWENSDYNFLQYCHLEVRICFLLSNLWLITHQSGIKGETSPQPWVGFDISYISPLCSYPCAYMCVGMYLHILQIQSYELCIWLCCFRVLSVMLYFMGWLREVKHLAPGWFCCQLCLQILHLNMRFISLQRCSA